MPIDFHAAADRESYAGRAADSGCMDVMREIVSPAGMRVIDIGCGGGIYSRAWQSMGGTYVTGVDFSAAMLDAARERSRRLPNVAYVQGDAHATSLPDASADIVFARALVHHIPDWPTCVREAYRLLRPGGTYIVQDKTPADVQMRGTPEYIGGYVFERFPRLLAVERSRRPEQEQVLRALAAAGFERVESRRIVETHRVYDSFAELASALRQRTGRFIVHELSDTELDDLVAYISERLPQAGPIVERVPWTLWWGRKPTKGPG